MSTSTTSAPSGTAERLVPDNGDYLTNGKRLVMVLKVHGSGAIQVEDAATDEVRLLTFAEYQANWRKVRRSHGVA